MDNAVLLQNVRNLVQIARDQGHYHPGLTLDKHLPAGNQESQKPALKTVCQAQADGPLLAALATRRAAAFATDALSFTATTAGALTLHLSRANALENAGIALHPLYGFAYLPGSGLKGAARAYAETVWLPTQADKVAASALIIELFGCAPGSERDKDWLPVERREAKLSQAGAVVFHDAWPQVWPKLFVDIAAIHHPKYYQGTEPPGDWETPSLVSFLAIPPGVDFRFTIAPRMSGSRVDAARLSLAKTWLTGALGTLGIGAKTSAGYGLFRTEPAPVPPRPGRAEASFDLTLVTPAFLAGAEQEKDDCDLRGATLRGQLRWWWRAMHAGHLETAKLRRLEAAIWGASSEGSAIQLQLTASDHSPAEPYQPKNAKFKSSNAIAEPRDNRVPGFAYLSYGMADKPGSTRHFRQPGDTWSLGLIARSSLFRMDPKAKRGVGIALDAGTVLAEATAALWLLTQYGGVGAKGRKGFGSLADISVPGLTDLAAVKQQATRLRELCRLNRWVDNAPRIATLERLEVVAVTLGWTNPWYTINAVGTCYQNAVKDPELKAAKELLGLPRKGVRGVTMNRLASAMHLHLARSPGSGLVARVATFDLPGINPKATQFLHRLRRTLDASLQKASKEKASGHADLYPARRGSAQPKSITPSPAGAGHRPAPPPVKKDAIYVGQRGHDAESGQSVEIKVIEGQRLRVLFIDDDEEEWIDVANFRPDRRR